MLENLKFKFNYYFMEIEMWWSDLWMSEDEKKEIKNSLKKGENRRMFLLATIFKR